MDEATWYLDSDDSSHLGSPSTPPTLNGEWPCLPQQDFSGLGKAMKCDPTEQESCPDRSHSSNWEIESEMRQSSPRSDL